MEATLWIEKIKFKDSTEITMAKDSIVVFVGPNNSGKTQMLKEILAETGGYSQSKIIIDKIELSTEGTADDFLAQLKIVEEITLTIITETTIVEWMVII